MTWIGKPKRIIRVEPEKVEPAPTPATPAPEAEPAEH